MLKNIFLLVLGFVVVLADEPNLQDFIVGSKQFTSAVYNELIVDNNENILVSPFSAETVLALTQSGAKGDTAAEIRTTLNLPESPEETEALMQLVLPTIHSDFYTLQTANKIYVENNFSIKETFKEVATDIYQASFQNIEFARGAEAAEEINTWVEEQTHDKIHDLIGPNDLDASTRLVLINALYFQANWTVPFQPIFTKKASFFTNNEDAVDVDMMYKESEEFNYAENEELDAQILELPFNGKGATMTIVLPKKKEGIAVLEKQIDGVLASPKFTNERVEVFLPRFKIETTIDFMEILEKLGVHKAFDGGEADFSGIAGEKGELYVTGVTQKTFIDVNEIGVEAAAATDVEIGESATLPATKKFVADHPFVFYISVNEIVLFEGRVLVPEH